MRIEQLGFTRFIAAILIVIFHYGLGSFLFDNESISFIFKQANIGVSYFFILSGFIMIIAYGNKEKIIFSQYFKNRLAHIYPIYILTLIYISGPKISDLVLNALLLQAWLPAKALTINAPGWALSVEFFFYASFPFLFNHFYKKYSLKKISFYVILFWVVSQIIFHLIVQAELIKIPFFSSRDIYYHPLMHFNEFLVGNLAGLFFIKKITKKKKNNLLYIILAILIILILLKFPLGLNYHNGLLAIIFAPLILLISSSKDKLTNFFSNKFFNFLGEISFSIYILQVPVWMILSNYNLSSFITLNNELNFTAILFIKIFLLILISSLMYLFVEKPIRIILKKI